MNRLTTFSAMKHHIRNTQVADTLGMEKWEESDLRHQGLEYRLLGPVGYEKNYAYPLVIWLHGPGDDERQVVNIMRHVSLQNYVSVAPRGPRVEASGCTYTWSQDDFSVSRARQHVHECVAIASERYHLHHDRIFIAGLQTGGTMALRLALAEPECFAGAISIGGAFPLGCNALLRYQAAQSLPLLTMRGLESETYTESDFCEELRIFHAAHLRVHCRHYLAGDELTVPMLKDMNSWLMEFVTGDSILDAQDSPTNYHNGS